MFFDNIINFIINTKLNDFLCSIFNIKIKAVINILINIGSFIISILGIIMSVYACYKANSVENYILSRVHGKELCLRIEEIMKIREDADLSESDRVLIFSLIKNIEICFFGKILNSYKLEKKLIKEIRKQLSSNNCNIKLIKTNLKSLKTFVREKVK